MAHAFTAEKLIKREVFGHLDSANFTAAQAAEYLEVSLPTLRRYVQSNNLTSKAVVGRSQLFAARALQAFKRSLRDAKR
jgi:excisionase family DNA binding protein